MSIWMKNEERLHGLPPKSSFIAVEALEHAAIEIGKAQEAIGQLPGADRNIGRAVEAVRLMLFANSLAAIRP